MLKRLILIFLLPLFITGCASSAIRDTGLDKLAPRKAEQELSAGINNYDNGNYQTAAHDLQNSINQGLTFTSDQVTAHKYLAFIYCISERKKLCSDEFKKALALDPHFELSATEAGHPIWGPVYRHVKKETSQTRKR
ncbi:MAG: TssQ family T6SS-associated lipoprotein [Sulfuriferula sp.]